MRTVGNSRSRKRRLISRNRPDGFVSFVAQKVLCVMLFCWIVRVSSCHSCYNEQVEHLPQKEVQEHANPFNPFNRVEGTCSL